MEAATDKLCVRLHFSLFIWYALLMINLELLREHTNHFVKEVWVAIIHQNLRATEPGQHILE